MKSIKKTALVEMAANFASLREQAKEIEKAQKEMRNALIAALGDEQSALIGEYLIILSERVRTDLDKDALAIELGDRFSEFQKQSSYQVLDIKKA